MKKTGDNYLRICFHVLIECWSSITIEYPPLKSVLEQPLLLGGAPLEQNPQHSSLQLTAMQELGRILRPNSHKKDSGAENLPEYSPEVVIIVASEEPVNAVVRMKTQ